MNGRAENGRPLNRALAHAFRAPVLRWQIGARMPDQGISCQPNKLCVELLVDTERRVEVVLGNVKEDLLETLFGDRGEDIAVTHAAADRQTVS